MIEIEFQTHSEKDIEERLLEYNFLATRQYELPVYSYLIYLRKDGEVVQPPYARRFPTGEVTHVFYFKVIKLWEIPAEFILRMGWLGLFPLLTLTKGGKKPEVVQAMVDRLSSAQEWDLLAASRIVGGLVFKKTEEREWFRRRFIMFQNVLRESWVYQEIGQEFREEERQLRRQGLYDAIMSLIQTHFPELVPLGKQQINNMTDPDTLQKLLLQLIAAQHAEEVEQILA